MFAETSAIRREEKNGAIECAAAAFDNAHDEIDAVRASYAAELINGGAGHIDTAFPIALKITAAFVGAISDDSAEIEATGIGGDKGLRKDDETCAFVCGFCAERCSFFKRVFAIKGNGCSLYDGGSEGIVHALIWLAEI